MAKDDSILPIAGRYLTDNLKNLYSTSIQQLIADLGREVVLTLPPSTSGCPNCTYSALDERSAGRYNTSNPFSGKPYNIPFAENQRCPVCLGTHTIKEKKTATWRATIVKSPKEVNYEKYGVSPENTVLTKTVINSFRDISNCVRATIDGLEYTRLSDPVKIGLGNNNEDLKFVNTIWKRAS